jgi:hypothetical protein
MPLPRLRPRAREVVVRRRCVCCPRWLNTPQDKPWVVTCSEPCAARLARGEVIFHSEVKAKREKRLGGRR